MPTASRLTWIQAAPKPGDLHFADCGPFSFEIIRTHHRDYLLQVWRYPPKGAPLLWWEYDGFSLDEAKGRAERLADEHVPVITQ
jgi:hypothetical protein